MILYSVQLGVFVRGTNMLLSIGRIGPHRTPAAGAGRCAPSELRASGAENPLHHNNIHFPLRRSCFRYHCRDFLVRKRTFHEPYACFLQACFSAHSLHIKSYHTVRDASDIILPSEIPPTPLSRLDQQRRGQLSAQRQDQTP